MHHRYQNTLEIDLASVRTSEELHVLLYEAFQFPDYYGKNWDAFDECIGDTQLPSLIEITGLEVLRSCLPRDAELLSTCLKDRLQQDSSTVLKIS